MDKLYWIWPILFGIGTLGPIFLFTYLSDKESEYKEAQIKWNNDRLIFIAETLSNLDHLHTQLCRQCISSLRIRRGRNKQKVGKSLT